MTSTPRRSQRLFFQFCLAGIFLLIAGAPASVHANEPNEEMAADAYFRGVDAMNKQDYDKATDEFSEAISFDPNVADGYCSRGHAYVKKDNYDLAIDDLSEAIRLKPNFAEAYNTRGFAYENKGDYDEAMADYNSALQLNPCLTEAYKNRGNAYAKKGAHDKAIADFNKAIADLNETVHLSPNDAKACNSLAWLWAVCPEAKIRNGAKAVEYAKKACELTEWKNMAAIDTFAAAYAEAGDFDDAVKWENKALEFTLTKAVADKERQRLSLYEQKKPYRDGN